MSSGGTTGGVDVPSTISTFSQPPQHYFCHQCNRTVSLPPSLPSDELSCPHCNGGFLEEVEISNPFSSPSLSTSPFAALFAPPTTSASDPLAPFTPFFFPPSSSASSATTSASDPLAPFTPFFFPPSSSASSATTSSVSPVEPVDLSAVFGHPHGGVGGDNRSPFQDNDVFNPFQFLQSYLQSMRGGGANIQFVIENASPEQGRGNFRLPSNLGDYFFGPGLEQLIQQLAENDPNRYGTPPASKCAVEALPTVKVTEELLSSDSSQCAVCMDEFQLAGEAKLMPCKHVFHSDCILPWLELHNSCPVCRYELPTDDPDYEQRSRVRRENTGSGGDGNVNAGRNDEGGSEGLQSDRTVERRLTISLPWPFGSAAASGSNAGSSNGSNQRRENPDCGPDTKMEDLD